MKALSLILIIIGSLLLGSFGWALYTNNLVKDTPSVTSSDTPPPAVSLKTEEGKEKPSVVQFTDKDNKPIGQLVVTDSISFQGQLDTSGLIFMSYIATQMSLHCEELMKNSPIKAASENPPEDPKKK